MASLASHDECLFNFLVGDVTQRMQFRLLHELARNKLARRRTDQDEPRHQRGEQQ